MTQKGNSSIIFQVSEYYTNKLLQHGQTPQGVDWNGEKSQILRFEQLCRILPPQTTGFSLNDLGCGYGALLDYLQNKYSTFKYIGVDISPEMIKAAEQLHVGSNQARFIASSEPDTIADYSVASGILNVRLQESDAKWFDYLQATLDLLDKSSRLGFSFNCLTSYSDEEKKQDYLYYSDPCRMFDLCKRRYARDVALLHDYGLYEFTILVRKTES